MKNSYILYNQIKKLIWNKKIYIKLKLILSNYINIIDIIENDYTSKSIKIVC